MLDCYFDSPNPGFFGDNSALMGLCRLALLVLMIEIGDHTFSRGDAISCGFGSCYELLLVVSELGGADLRFL